MKILTNKKYKQLIAEIEYLKGHAAFDKQYREQIEAELKEAKSFKELIERLATPKTLLYNGSGFSFSGSYDPLNNSEIIFQTSEGNKTTWVSDELSSDVITKEKSTKIVFLNKDGDFIKSGYTKQKADKGFSYKLVRE